jgi:hypothetical protein
MELGITPLFVDNTNSALWEMRAYIELADRHGYSVHVIDPRSLCHDALDVGALSARCREREEQIGKSIPRQVLERMVSNFEDVDGDDELLEAARAAQSPWDRKAKGPPQPIYVGLDVEPQVLSALGGLNLGPLFCEGDATIVDYIHARYTNRWELPKRLHVTVRFFGGRIAPGDKWMLRQAKDLCQAQKFSAQVREIVFVHGGGLLVAPVEIHAPEALESLAYAAGEEAWYPHVTLFHEKPWRAVDSNAVLEALAWARLDAETEQHRLARLDAETEQHRLADVPLTEASSNGLHARSQKASNPNDVGTSLSSCDAGDAGKLASDPNDLMDASLCDAGDAGNLDANAATQSTAAPGAEADNKTPGTSDANTATQSTAAPALEAELGNKTPSIQGVPQTVNESYTADLTVEVLKNTEVCGRKVDLVVFGLKEPRLLRNCPFELFDNEGVMRS